MKRRFINILLFALTVSLLSDAPIYGQAQEGQARDLFTSYAATGTSKGQPGAKIKIELLRERRRQFVPLDTMFRAGDKVKLHVEVNFAAHVTIYNLGSSGKISRLYPVQGKYATAVASTNYVVPASATEWFEFDDTPGTEKLNFTFSSVAPQRRQARPATKPTPEKKETDVVIVEPGGRAFDYETDNQSNDEAMTNGSNIKRVQLKNEHYVFGNTQKLQRAVGVLIALQHK